MTEWNLPRRSTTSARDWGTTWMARAMMTTTKTTKRMRMMNPMENPSMVVSFR